MKRQTKSRWVPWALLLFWTALIVSADLVFVTTTWRQHRAAHFASTTGKIAQSGLGQGALGRRGLRLRYTYSVNGVKYTGSRYRYDDDSVSLRYDKVLAEFPPHSVHTVYYNPLNPRDSALSTGVDGCDLLLMLVAVPFNVVTIAVWPPMLARRRRGTPLEALSGLKLMRENGQLIVRFNTVSALDAGLIALAAAAIVEASIVILRWRYTESIPLMVTMWTIAVGLGTIAAFWQNIKNNSGEHDLRIDASANTLTLPAVVGKGSREVRCDAVRSLTALRRLNKTRSGSHWSFVPALVLSSGAETRLAPLVAWGWSESRALAFGGWLAKELGVDFKGEQDERAAAPPAVAGVTASAA